jgi:hypothetical protein
MKQRPRQSIPSIHSKGVAYVNNGGGRDTYISESSGGLRAMHAPAAFKRTFYNNLRVYDRYSVSRNAPRSRTGTRKEDVFMRSQQHFNEKVFRESSYIRNY